VIARALCQWKDGCRATAEVESDAGVYCSLHAALRDAADERPVTWRALARATAIMALPILLFLAGCGRSAPTTDDAGWVGIAVGAAILGVMVGVGIGFRIAREVRS